jgi:outer membrane receptor protein involved in Fe transport
MGYGINKYFDKKPEIGGNFYTSLKNYIGGGLTNSAGSYFYKENKNYFIFSNVNLKKKNMAFLKFLIKIVLITIEV